jgi:hypothetical protein
MDNILSVISPIPNISSISSIIPSIIFGLILIILWIPVIYFTEKNNKGNNDEYKLLLEKINTNLKVTDITNQITYRDINNLTVDYYNVESTNFINKNIYINSVKTIKTKDNKGKEIIQSFQSSSVIIPPLVNGVPMNDDNYTYLANYNKIKTIKTTGPNEPNTSYEINIYAIPINSQIMKIEGLQEYQNELDFVIYDYEFGPENAAINNIKKRKEKSDMIQKWGGRFLTFLMLFIGLSTLVSPIRILNNLGAALPGPLSLIAVPGSIILSIYDTLSLFGSLILTVLMTLFIWSYINYPYVSIIFGGLLIGFIIYFRKIRK